jgi:predicted  nucleic acid-binding Zn-ribbon protein
MSVILNQSEAGDVIRTLQRALATVRAQRDEARKELNRGAQRRYAAGQVRTKMAEQRAEMRAKHKEEIDALRDERDRAKNVVHPLRRENQKLRGELIAARDRITRLEQELAKVGG